MPETEQTETTEQTTEQTTEATATETTNEETVQETKSSEQVAEKTEENVVEKESTEQEQPQTETKAESEQETPIERLVPKADDYVLPEGVPKVLAEFAEKNDMTQEQFDNTINQFGVYIKGTADAQKKVLADAGEAHADSWGENRDYNLALVRRALAQNDPSGGLKTMLNETGYGNHPAVLDFFLKVGESMKEGGFIKGSVHRPEGKKTAATAMFGKTHPSN